MKAPSLTVPQLSMLHKAHEMGERFWPSNMATAYALLRRGLLAPVLGQQGFWCGCGPVRRNGEHKWKAWSPERQVIGYVVTAAGIGALLHADDPMVED